jgi:hypothetical protein
VHEDAFTALKSALSSAPVLQLPNFSLLFELETDASAGGIGVFLSQQGHPIAFVNKALGIKNQGLSTYEKEYLVLGVCFVVEGPVRRNTFGRSTQKQSRSYHPGSFGIVTRLETEGCTDLKMKR